MDTLFSYRNRAKLGNPTTSLNPNAEPDHATVLLQPTQCETIVKMLPGRLVPNVGD